MGIAREAHPTVVRSPYFYQDPIRASGLICALLLMFLSEIPFTIALFAVGISQVNCIAMLLDVVGQGWTMKWGRRARAAVLTNNLAIDWANTSVCTLVGAMLLLRLFGPPQLVVALGCLTLAVGLVPDIRFCRILLPADPSEASRILDRCYFFRDPIKLGALGALAVVCSLDRTSLAFVFVSMVLIQLNAILVFVDKYLGEVETRRRDGWIPSRTVRLVLARDGQRLLLTLLPIAMVPLRLGTDDPLGRWAAAVVASLIVVPDLVRMGVRLIGALFGYSWDGAPAKA